MSQQAVLPDGPDGCLHWLTVEDGYPNWQAGHLGGLVVSLLV